MKNQIIRMSAAVALLTFAMAFKTMAQERVWSIGPEVGAAAAFGKQIKEGEQTLMPAYFAAQPRHFTQG